MLDEVAHKRQYEYCKIMQDRLKEWAEIEGAKVVWFDYVACFGEALGVYVFYKTNKELSMYIENGVVERTKQNFIRIFDGLGYFKEFNDNIRFVFDSRQNVKKNFKGNYYYRLLDG